MTTVTNIHHNLTVKLGTPTVDYESYHGYCGWSKCRWVLEIRTDDGSPLVYQHLTTKPTRRQVANLKRHVTASVSIQNILRLTPDYKQLDIDRLRRYSAIVKRCGAVEHANAIFDY